MVGARIFFPRYFFPGLLPCLALCGHASALPLDDAINAARGYDSSYLAARNARDAGHEKRIQGRAGLLPQARIDAGYSMQDQPDATYATAVHRHNYAVSVTQPIFDLARIANYKRGASLSNTADVEFAKAEQSLIIGVSNAYFDVLFQHEVLAATQAAEKAFLEQLQQARSTLKMGEGTRIEVDEAQANYDQAAAQAIAAANGLEINNAVYTRLTGMPPGTIEPVRWSCIPPVAPNPDALMSEAETDNLDVRAAQLKVKQAQADVLTAQATHTPVVNLQASYGMNWSRGADENVWDQVFGTTSKTSVRQVGVNISIPVFSGGSGLSQTREAYSRREEADAALEDARRKAREQTRAAYLTLTNGQALIHAKERAVDSANTRVESTRMGQQAGMRTTIDVLNAQQHYFEAVRDLAEARNKFLKARLLLSAALDMLEADTASLSCRRANNPPNLSAPAPAASAPMPRRKKVQP
jgi:outer membrane protein